HAAAMNRARPPLDRSLIDVIGEVSSRAHAPLVPSPALDPETLTPERIHDLTEMFKALSRVWHLRLDADFPWHGYDTTGLSQTTATQLALDLATLGEQLAELDERADDLAGELLLA